MVVEMYGLAAAGAMQWFGAGNALLQGNSAGGAYQHAGRVWNGNTMRHARVGEAAGADQIHV